MSLQRRRVEKIEVIESEFKSKDKAASRHGLNTGRIERSYRYRVDPHQN